MASFTEPEPSIRAWPAGLDTTANTSAGVALTTQDFDTDSNPLYLGGDVEAFTLMPVVYYDFHTGGHVRPFVGVGGGLGVVDSNAELAVPLTQDGGSNFAWQASEGRGRADHVARIRRDQETGSRSETQGVRAFVNERW